MVGGAVGTRILIYIAWAPRKNLVKTASSTELNRVARYVRFLIISACDKEKGLCLSPFAVQKEVKSIVSNPVSVQVSNSPKSKANAEGVTVDNRTLPSAATTEPEPMTTDNVSIHSSDNETESDNAIEFNPLETIDETPPVLQQQPSISTTVADKTSFKQRVKKCPVRWVDFKEFYNEQELSTLVHNKYLKKHQIKRLQ
ncbi:hypothetical protein AVEN_265429-1 [Araneus ventricosus]|uniref:Uncharacterized protein n=1 Tax=Araneus ventricosus TaxID=182803 RepID=A0A4Y2X061_ARAVE|nr:hypothetical protein AVEN_69916-1 [Araneus ventricosus]GBO41422.1 hypothetical protein AVEN_265429-1 [Araneus ventricosus]